MKIELKNVSKKFENQVLESFSHSFAQRGIYSIMGESGGGKSTLLKLIGGVWQADEGELVFSPPCGKISFLFQEDRLLPWLTAGENVRAVASDDRQCLALFENLGLLGSENLYPHEMSGGMKRRVALARALAYDGEVFLLDEPFSGIDLERKQQILEWIKPLLLTKLCIVVSHDIEEVRFLGEAVFSMKKNCLMPLQSRPFHKNKTTKKT